MLNINNYYLKPASGAQGLVTGGKHNGLLHVAVPLANTMPGGAAMPKNCTPTLAAVQRAYNAHTVLFGKPNPSTTTANFVVTCLAMHRPLAMYSIGAVIGAGASHKNFNFALWVPGKKNTGVKLQLPGAVPGIGLVAGTTCPYTGVKGAVLGLTYNPPKATKRATKAGKARKAGKGAGKAGKATPAAPSAGAS